MTLVKAEAARGGSIGIEADTITVSGNGNVTALGGSQGDTSHGGGLGRIAVYYHTSFSGSFTPNYLEMTGSGRPDPIYSNSFETGNLDGWTSSSTDGGNLSASASSTFWGNFGLQAAINDN